MKLSHQMQKVWYPESYFSIATESLLVTRSSSIQLPCRHTFEVVVFATGFGALPPGPKNMRRSDPDLVTFAALAAFGVGAILRSSL